MSAPGDDLGGITREAPAAPPPTLEDAQAFIAGEIVRRERALKAGRTLNPERERKDLACLKLIAQELAASTREAEEVAQTLVAQVRQQEKGSSGKLWFQLSPQEAAALVVRALRGYARRQRAG